MIFIEAGFLWPASRLGLAVPMPEPRDASLGQSMKLSWSCAKVKKLQPSFIFPCTSPCTKNTKTKKNNKKKDSKKTIHQAHAPWPQCCTQILRTNYTLKLTHRRRVRSSESCKNLASLSSPSYSNLQSTLLAWPQNQAFSERCRYYPNMSLSRAVINVMSIKGGVVAN